jgi:hypothetical protein
MFMRARHPDFNELQDSHWASSGIYMIGCAGRVVYVGQTVGLNKRSIQSLGRFYHRVSDVSLPWSIAYAPCRQEERNERESTAIRALAPKFNTSIPGLKESQGRMPEITGVAPIFADQTAPCGAFNHENLEAQRQSVAAMEGMPNWKPSKPRKPSVRRPKVSPEEFREPEWSKEKSDNIVRALGSPANGPLHFRINLCDDGDVVTIDGEYIGTWRVDAYTFYCFVPDGAAEPMFIDPFMGRLCATVEKWHADEVDDDTHA